MSDTFLVLFVSVVYVCTCRSLQDEIRIACRGLSRLSGQGYGRSVRGGGAVTDQIDFANVPL